MSGWQRNLSTICVGLICMGYCSLGWGEQRPVLGIVPFQFNYPVKTLDWAGYFLQEELTHQLALSRKFAPRPALSMQLWSQTLELINTEQINQKILLEMGLQQLLQGKLQKVIGYASFKGTLFYLDENQQLQQTPLQSTFSWQSPDDVIEAFVKTLAQIAPALADFTIFPQGYQWESLEAFYQWKLQSRQEPGTKAWQQYKEELEALLSHYPDISRLIYPELAGLLLLEGTQPVINATLLKQAQEAIQEALRLDPKNGQNYVLLAQIYYFLNDRNAAKAEAVIANAQNPQNAMAQVLYGLTISQTPEEQEKHILAGLKKNPFLIEFPFFVNRNLASYEALLPLLNTAGPATNDPLFDSSDTYSLALLEGREYFSQKQWQLAQERFEQAVALKPQQLEPQLYLTRIAIAQREYQGALETLLQLKELFPDNQEVLLYLGLVYERLNTYDQAEAHYREVLFLKADHPQGLLRLGTVLIKTQQYSEAQNYLETLVRKFPNYSVGWWNLGLLHAQQKQWPQAHASIKEALRLDPNNSKIQETLAKIQEKLP